MTLALDGKVVIITGSARNLGHVTVQRFHGGECPRGARRPRPWSRRRGRGGYRHRRSTRCPCAIAVMADVTQPADVTALFDRATEEFGRIDILINNAGLVAKPSPPGLRQLLRPGPDRRVGGAYLGANLAALIEIKYAYDPDEFFHFPQSIPATQSNRQSRR